MKQPRTKKRLKKVLFVLAGLFIFVIVLLAGALILLQTQMVKDRLAGYASQAASSETVQVKLENLTGRIPWRMRLGSVTLSDPQGIWCVIRDLELDWNMGALLGGWLKFPRLHIQEVEYKRSPPSGEKPSETDPLAALENLQFPKLEIGDLHIARVVLSPPFSSPAKIFTVKGVQDSDGEQASLNLVVKRLEGPDDHLTVAAKLAGRPMHLALETELVEAPGGLLGGMIGLPRPETVKLSLRGNGPLTDWRGNLTAAAQDMLNLETAITLAYQRGLSLKLDGRLQTGEGVLPQQAALWLGRTVDYRLNLLYSPEKLALEPTEIKTDYFHIHAQGGVEFKNRKLDSTFRIVVRDPAPIVKTADVRVAPGQSIEARLGGTADRPVLTLTSDIQGLAAHGWSAEKINLDLRVNPTRSLKEGWQHIDSQGKIKVTRLKSPWPELASDAATLDFDLAVLGKDRLSIRTLKLDSPDANLEVNGFYAFESKAAQAQVKIDAPNLARLIPGKSPVSGPVSLRTEIQGIVPQQLKASLQLQAPDLKGIPPGAAHLTNPRADLEAQVILTGHTLKVEEFTLRSKSILKVKGEMNFDRKSVDAAYTMKVVGLSAFSRPPGIKLPGEAMLAGNIKGPLADMSVEVESMLDKVAVSGHVVEKTEIKIKAAHLPKDIKGHVRIQAAKGKTPLSLDADVAYAKNSLNVSGFKAEIPGAIVTADLGFQTDSGLIKGRVDLKSPDLKPIGGLFGQDLAGGAEVKAVLAPVKDKQSLQANIKATNPAYQGIRVAELTLNASLPDLKNPLNGKVDLKARNFRHQNLNMETIHFTGQPGGNGRIQIALQGRGSHGKPLDIKLTGSIAAPKASSKSHDLVISTLQAKYADIPLNLASPLNVSIKPDGWSAQPLDLRVGQGSIKGSGRMTTGSVAAEVNIQNLTLETFKFLTSQKLAGVVGGNITLQGSPGRPQVKSNLKLTNLGFTTKGAKALPPVSLDADLTLAQPALQANVRITGLGPSPGTVTLSLPMRFSLRPFDVGPTQSGQLSGRVQADLDMKIIPVLASLEDQAMDGITRLDLNLSGTANRPQVSGQVTVSQGKYENVHQGLVLENITAEIQAQGPRLTLTQARATDGQNGSLTAQGSIVLDAAQNYPYQFQVNADQLSPFRRELFTTRIVGNMAMSGTNRGGKLSGKLTLDPSELNIPKKMPAGVADVDVMHVNAPITDFPPKKEKKQVGGGSTYKLDMDIGLEVPARFYVRGDGLESEWKASLQIRGSSDKPDVKGDIQAIRGRYSFLGRTFRLTKGDLKIGGSPPTPIIQIIGEFKAKDVTAQLKMTGPPSDLKLELSSTPELPRDEVLARVLFGKQLSNVSPFQALSLARAAGELTGQSGSDLDVLGKTRSALGLDQLEVKTGDSGDTAVGAGKYLGDQVYVEAQGGLKPEDQKVSVEIEVTPNISVESEIGADSQGGVGINWKYDY